MSQQEPCRRHGSLTVGWHAGTLVVVRAAADSARRGMHASWEPESKQRKTAGSAHGGYGWRIRDMEYADTALEGLAPCNVRRAGGHNTRPAYVVMPCLSVSLL